MAEATPRPTLEVTGPNLLEFFAGKAKNVLSPIAEGIAETVGKGTRQLLGQPRPQDQELVSPLTQEQPESIQSRAVSMAQELLGGEKETEPITPFDDALRESFGDDFDDAIRVLGGENAQFDPEAENTSNSDGSVDRGVFQINSIHFSESEFNRRKEKMAAAGIDVSSPEAAWEDMFDPAKNIAMARIIFDEQGWDGWIGAPRDLLSDEEIERREGKGIGIRE